MEKMTAILLTFALLLSCAVSGVGASRVVASGTLAEAEDARAMLGYCSSARCGGYTDKDESAKHQLQFLSPQKSIDAPPVGRAEVAAVRGYAGYDHGKLHDCDVVKGMFSYGPGPKDWSTHMQENMREGIWPNSPGEKTHYKCAERCKLKIYGEDGTQLNKGGEADVWVERDGHSGTWVQLPVLGWKAPTCTVGNALQEHWMKQQFQYTQKDHGLMVDADGLPAWPFQKHLQPKFTEVFCALGADQKESVTLRVTSHRPNMWSIGPQYYGNYMFKVKRRNYFPKGFPQKCSDGWFFQTAAVTKYESDEYPGFDSESDFD